MRRLQGLDLARFLAFAGMVKVNFKYEVWTSSWGQKYLEDISDHVDGKATAVFVLLAGIGIVLMSDRMEPSEARWCLAKRALFLMVIGFINMAFIQWDILHFYAVFFLMGVLVLYWYGWALLLLALFFCGLFVVLYINFDYNSGWSWNPERLRQTDVFTWSGFFRSWLFNGFHPVVPYVSFFFVGMAIARMNLRSAKTQYLLITLGILGLAISHVIALQTPQSIKDIEVFGYDLSIFLSLRSMPPVPVYVLSGIGTACLLIGLCLRVNDFIDKSVILKAMASGGRMALTLYLAHIWIGIGMLVHLDHEHSLDLWFVLLFSLMFTIACAFYAHNRIKNYGYGPFEKLLRRVTD